MYTIAYKSLREHYHGYSRPTEMHLNALLDLPAIPSTNLRELRVFLNTFIDLTPSLELLKCFIISESNPLTAAKHLLRKIDQDSYVIN